MLAAEPLQLPSQKCHHHDIHLRGKGLERGIIYVCSRVQHQMEDGVCNRGRCRTRQEGQCIAQLWLCSAFSALSVETSAFLTSLPGFAMEVIHGGSR